MASATMTAVPAAPRFEDGFATMNRAWRRWRVAATTRTELSALSDRSLTDLGIRRADIARLSREAADRV